MRSAKTSLIGHVLMGLEYRNNAYYYADRYSQVCYKELQSVDDTEKVPILGIYTRRNSEQNYKFVGISSYRYLFVGNAKIVDSVIESIDESGMATLHENNNFNSKNTWFRSEIVLRNPNSIQHVGDVYPLVNIWNSYDGSSIAKISFGLALNGGVAGSFQIFSFSKLLGYYSQAHIQGSKSKLTYLIGGYVENLNSNITEFVNMNCNNILSTETVLHTLELIKEMGKRRYLAISNFIAELTESNRPVTSWDMFLAVSRYTTSEKNLNAKVLLENIVESLMVAPTEMMGHLNRRAA